MAEQREYKKKKAQKKVQRMKELEQEREDQKSKWQQFNNKAYSKNKKGQVRILLYLDVSWQFVPWRRYVLTLLPFMRLLASHDLSNTKQDVLFSQTH